MFFESPGFHAISFPKHCQVLPVEVERAPVTLLVGFKRADAPGAVAAAFVAEHGLDASYQAGGGVPFTHISERLGPPYFGVI